MKFRFAPSILLGFIWAFWIIPLEGKKRFPEVFGAASVQWPCLAILSLLIPIVFIIALNRIFGSTSRRKGFAILLLASIPLFTNLTFWMFGSSFQGRIAISLGNFAEPDGILGVRLADLALNGNTASDREKAAGLLYGQFGFKPLWKNANGDLERLEPSPKVQAHWESINGSTKQVKESKAMMREQLEQLPWLFAIQLGSFSLILLGGLRWKAFRPDHRSLAGGSPSKPETLVNP